MHVETGCCCSILVEMFFLGGVVRIALGLSQPRATGSAGVMERVFSYVVVVC